MGGWEELAWAFSLAFVGALGVAAWKLTARLMVRMGDRIEARATSAMNKAADRVVKPQIAALADRVDATHERIDSHMDREERDRADDLEERKRLADAQEQLIARFDAYAAEADRRSDGFDERLTNIETAITAIKEAGS